MELNAVIEARVRSIIEEVLPHAFVVELGLRVGKSSALSVLVDTDAGITIDECAKLSRRLGRWVDEENPFEFAFHLEVSSPGVGKPLRIRRQYLKEIGRKLKVTTLENTVLRGVLSEVGETSILLTPAPKASNPKNRPTTKQATEPQNIPFENIKEAKVEISFG